MGELESKVLDGFLGSYQFDSREHRLLVMEWGQKNVETALIFIHEQRDRNGLHVAIQPTYEMVRDVLEAVHGRLGVGHVKVGGLDGARPFYHFPTLADTP